LLATVRFNLSFRQLVSAPWCLLFGSFVCSGAISQLFLGLLVGLLLEMGDVYGDFGKKSALPKFSKAFRIVYSVYFIF
jgi:hypothetical protein